MPYDYYLLGGFFVGLLGILGIISAMVDQRSPMGGVVICVIASTLIYYSWLLSEKTLVGQDLPDAFFRILGRIVN